MNEKSTNKNIMNKNITNVSIMNAELSSRQKIYDYISDRYANDAIYEMLGTPFIYLFEFDDSRIEYEEYYYLVIKTLDTFKRHSKCGFQSIDAFDLEKNLNKFMSRKLGIENPQREVIVVIGFVLWLIERTHNDKYNNAHSVLLHLLYPKYNNILRQVERICYRCRDTHTFEKYNQWVESVKTYLDSKEYYSDEIDVKFGLCRRSMEKLGTEAGQEEKEEDEYHEEENQFPFRIANGKKWHVMAVLNAIYLAGWIENANGTPLKSCRDATVNHIACNGFGESEWTEISQSLSSSNDPEKNKQIQALNELREAIIRDLEKKNRRQKGI